MNSVRQVALLLLIAGGTQVLFSQPERPIKRPPGNQLALEGPDAPLGRVDSPAAIAATTAGLVFHTSPLSSKGLLSQQVEDALKAIDRANGNAVIVKLRAFVAGTGDLRRVQTIVNDQFTQKKLPLPVIATVQVGSLTQEGAQVVLESVSEEKKTMNPNGLAFIPTVEGVNAAAAIDALKAAAGSSEPLRVTCFADSLAEANAARTAAARAFPKAARAFVQSTRYTLGSRVACEAVAQGGPVQSPKLLFAAPQLTFGEKDAELAQAFERLDKTLDPLGVKRSDAVLTNAYAISRAVADKARAMGAASSVFVEGLPALDATLAVEAVIPTQ